MTTVNDRSLLDYANDLHRASLNWIRPGVAVCHTTGCDTPLPEHHIRMTELQGHCPGCADVLNFPVMPPF
ncbi:hypothetical protein [Amycolatopsis saalfeldensis]|uniref:Uncharacterized protein n=1 Tax=Amycolatopsis saalfeldensis TaxID=394193 RepID=A0A1H8YP41_9PSEU|nr:hypothetical protein [Amycolatopsis saalfeldensis]SEP53950.1 hypothetical protein SAMN04489732_1345 [Amycolatopsis saalfeldensis]